MRQGRNYKHIVTESVSLLLQVLQCDWHYHFNLQSYKRQHHYGCEQCCLMKWDWCSVVALQCSYFSLTELDFSLNLTLWETLVYTKHHMLMMSLYTKYTSHGDHTFIIKSTFYTKFVMKTLGLSAQCTQIVVKKKKNPFFSELKGTHLRCSILILFILLFL